MLATYPQFSPQTLMATPLGAALFAPPGLHGGNAFFGHEPAFAGFVPPSYPFAPFGASHPLAQTLAMVPGYPSTTINPFVQGYPFLQSSPILQSYPPIQAPYAPAQQIVLALGQLAQQIAVQSAVNQQIGFALQQLTHQLVAHNQPGLFGLGLGSPYAPTVSPFNGAPSPFIGTAPGMYAGFGPQNQPAWQTWGGPRTQTIQ